MPTRALRDKVRCSDPRWEPALNEWLAGVYVANDLGARSLPAAPACRPAACG
jgi:hypothetical protein